MAPRTLTTDVPTRAASTRTRVRDPQKTRARLLEVATQEFARAGYDGARVERITRLAGCNPRMLYHYFGSKERLYRTVLDTAYADLRAGEQALDLDAEEPVGALGRLVLFTFDYMRANALFVRLTRSENLLGGRHVKRSRAIRDQSRPLLDSLERLLARGCAQGCFSHRIDPLQLYVSIVALSVHHLNNAHTLSAVFGENLTDRAWVDARRSHALRAILGLVGATRVPQALLAEAAMSSEPA